MRVCQHLCRLHVATRKNTVRRMIGPLECGLVSLTKHHPVNVSQATYLQRPESRRKARSAEPLSDVRAVSLLFAKKIGRSVVAFAVVASSAGCILTKDLPDPALDIPEGLQGGAAGQSERRARRRSTGGAAFAPRELTAADGGGPDGQPRTLRRQHRPLPCRPMRRRGSPARRCCRACNGSGQETYSRTSGSSSSGLDQSAAARWSTIRPRSSASYELDFWGKNRDAAQAAEETATANRFDRDVVALTTLATRRQRLFPGAGLAGPHSHGAAQHRQRAPHPRCDQAAAAGRHRHRSRRRAAGKRARQPARAVPPLRQTLDQNINALATLVSRPPESVRVDRRVARTTSRSRASRPACRRNC